MNSIINHTFTLDPFQKEAIKALEEGHSVVVSAPTGSGKTAIAEYVIEEALKTKDKVFYTTPLKALSNQKFHDFQIKYGKHKIGILTGDTALNRDAQILVMTTEIYRNMLYGTVLGTVDENLKSLRYVVLDECHYMNDPERGTVWEESIIYSPKNIQILALSATIENAKDLTNWISEVHGNTRLIESFERPVPLRFYYARDYHLVPLLTTDKKLNPTLKEHKDSFKAHKQKFRDLKRIKHKRTATVPVIIKNVHEKGLLPAIYFVFSRKGCETALKECEKLSYTLLTHEEKNILEKLIRQKIYGNDYLLKHKHLGPLYQGMAVHHAGLLPQWKAIVEELFSKGLIKVVFATETLAAGINMPAKTTIISNLGKRGNEGHKTLTSNEFLQMSGRAGRRGMDKIGNVIIKETFDHTPAFAAKLATSPPNPLISQFTPNYSMALNLLQKHTMEEIKMLLNKSFGQYIINKNLKKFGEEKTYLEKKLKTLTTYPCPDPKNPGDIRIFRKQDEKIHELKRALNNLAWQEHSVIKGCEERLSEALLEHQNFPCFPCPNKKSCFKMEKGSRKTKARLKEIKELVNEQEHFYWNKFLKIVSVLTKLGYLKNNIPTDIGIMAGSLRGENIILISEILLNCDFSNLVPEEFAGCMSSLAIDEVRPRTFTKIRAGANTDKIIFSMQKVARDLMRLQRDSDLEFRTDIITNLCALVEHWAGPSTKWNDLLTLTNLDEGDIVRAARRTMDLLRHIKNAPHLKPEVNDLARYALELMDKEPVKEVV